MTVDPGERELLAQLLRVTVVRLDANRARFRLTCRRTRLAVTMAVAVPVIDADRWMADGGCGGAAVAFVTRSDINVRRKE